MLPFYQFSSLLEIINAMPTHLRFCLKGPLWDSGYNVVWVPFLEIGSACIGVEFGTCGILTKRNLAAVLWDISWIEINGIYSQILRKFVFQKLKMS